MKSANAGPLPRVAREHASMMRTSGRTPLQSINTLDAILLGRMPVTWTVPSQSDPGKSYTVTFDASGFRCTCPGFAFRRHECKHIYAVKLAEGLIPEAQPTIQTRPTKRFVEHPMVRGDAVEDREYQRKMVSEALESNTLVVLPTALGKTVVAELVAAELLHRHPDSRILVMAPTKPLVLQHRDSFLRHLRLTADEVAVVTGEVPGRESGWENPSAKAVFATPQAAWNDVRAGLVRLEEFSLLVFDECHRSRSRYAYTKLASEYARRCPWPLIVALTASPGSEEDKVIEVCRNLLIEKIVWRTEDDEDVNRYIPGVSVGWEKVELPPEYQEVRSFIKRMIEPLVKQLYSSGRFKVPLSAVNRKTIVQFMARLRAEIDSGIKGPNMHYMAVCSAVLSLYHALELVESQHIHSLRKYLEEVGKSELRSHRLMADSPDFRELVRMAERVRRDHPKLEKLVQLVKRHILEKPDDRVMVFANIRHTAEAIVERLRENGIPAELFVGKAEGKEGPRMTQEQQRQVLQRFREGETSVLVATSIGEEGLDIPECGYVVFYEPAVSGIRYIQRRGRTGRKLPGKVTILLAKNTVDEHYFREGYRRAKKMSKVLEKAAERLKDFKLQRKGPKPEPGQPWPWARKRETLDAMAAAQSEEKTEIPEVTALRTGPSSREVFHYARYLYKKLLQAGLQGLTEAEILQDPDQKPDVIRAAVKHLERDGLVTRSGGRVIAKAVVRSFSKQAEGEIHEIKVEKVGPGFAVVWVDNRFRARLTPERYNGPRELIRKGSSFKARVTIHKEGETTAISVHDVVALQRA